jgi:membrane-associated HD superfamily phosphohydrolase
MNANVEGIYQVIEEIKENITDNQYKTIMDNLMALNRKEQEAEEENVIDSILDQIEFFNQYIPSINDANTKSQFLRRLDLLKRTVFDLTRC